ncbi:hypothetical protein C0993_000958 [Termitomyces sp. T159_Od127]|nr:hypothetical protein C0993_000958 [Termitomyces sp. T159_Od127]
MEFLSQTYVALRGPTGAPQTPQDTINRLSDRLSPAALLADRRAAVLALKGLSRDCKRDVGDRALSGLLEVLANDAEVDADIGKAVLETLQLLCDTEDGDVASKELGFKYTDQVLTNENTTHTLLSLLGDQNFYTRFATLQYLLTLLHNRRQLVQGYFLKSPNGTRNVVSVLEDKREIIRNGQYPIRNMNRFLLQFSTWIKWSLIELAEVIALVQALISQSPDIQKVLAFEGAFEKLFTIVSQEGGVEGGAVTSSALTCVDSLLRFNSSNQSYFRETALPPVLCSLLLFPPNIHIRDSAPQEFALQFWDNQKQHNASLVVGIIGMLVGSKGAGSLRLLPPNLIFPLSELTLTPYMPVPETNGEEWDRLEPASALDVLVELALHGEYNGLESGKRNKDGLELRAAAVSVFENVVQKDEVRRAILQVMLPSEGSSGPGPVIPLLHALVAPPNTTSALNLASVTSTHLATFIFSHLVRSSSRAKALARTITPSPVSSLAEPSVGSFFVPADGTPPAPPPQPEEEDDEPPQSVLHVLSENLSLSFLSRSRASTSDRESREWDRLVIGYLCLLAQWLWEDPQSVREFLDAGGFGTLVEPINQTSETDTVIPALATIYPILNRLGVDTLVGRMARLREDERFKAVGPDTVVLPYPSASHLQPSLRPEREDEGEIWFDWAFVDFWKSNYYTIQRGFSAEPDQLSSSASGQNAESAILVASLRDMIRSQSQEIESLQHKVKELMTANDEEVALMNAKVNSLSLELRQTEKKQKDTEKEQEDLLVLLDEMTSKRKKDKAKLKELGQEVSEDEGEDDCHDDEE